MIQTGYTYEIKNVKSGLCVDLRNMDNKSVIGFGSHGGSNQKWVFDFHGSDLGWSIKSVRSGQFLGIEDDLADGVSLVAVRLPFLWEIKQEEQNKDACRFVVPHTKYNMDLLNSKPMTRVTLWSHTEGANQIWVVKDA